MRKAIIFSLAALAAAQVSANSFGLKPGLWETHILKLVVDGQDKSGMMADASSKMQAAMANLPPEQRARMEAMMNERGGGPSMGAGGVTRICISPEMASSDKPYVGNDAHCDPASISRSGNHTSFTVSCTTNGETSTGKGESTVTGDLIASTMDMTTKKSGGEAHTQHIETEMKFLGTDCGSVKPFAPPRPGQ
jgi:hypothetical protein